MKQRLVGAVILVSLAVIFIPMLLDGEQEGGIPMFGSNVPDNPDYRFEPLEIPLEPVKPIPEEKPRLIDKPEPSESQSATEEEAAKEPEPTPARPVEDETPQETPAPAVVEAAPQTDEAPVGWVVQVGSFSKSQNALSLRDKLREQGFSAFVEKLKVDQKITYRVRIGPELKRSDAEALLDRLQSEMQMKGIVMGHSS
ncbi:MAG: SPOR domain-containing protein [Pseudomonadota bacterium]